MHFCRNLGVTYCNFLESQVRFHFTGFMSLDYCVNKRKNTQGINIQRIWREIKIYGFWKFLGNRFTPIFRVITFFGGSSKALSSDISGYGRLLYPLIFYLPDTHHSLSVILFFLFILLLLIERFSSIRIFLTNISVFKVPPVSLFYAIFISWSLLLLYILVWYP